MGNLEMSLQTKLLVALGAAVVTFGAFASTASFAKNDEIEFRCRARGPGKIKLQARYEERVRPRGTRAKFNAEFEALPNGSFTAGQQISIVVDSVAVGTVQLALAPSGELSGELELDSKPQAGHTPLPANFPDVSEGSVVEARSGNATLLGCTLD
jgi:hypothetical protein